jgi:hypothetical protein
LLEKSLAVRSSATAGTSFAGIYQSFLNVRGMDNLLSAVKGCYASLWTPRAVAYRRKMKIRDDEVLQAVVILEMVAAEAAGVGFTCYPRSGREDVALISANFGLGESVVNGAVEPDEYQLNYLLKITQKTIGRKEGTTVFGKDGGTEFIKSAGLQEDQVLADNDIRKLGLLIQRVFYALGLGEQHQDIEWVFDGEEFVLVQARPVTALPRYTCEGIKNQPDMWSNANFRDVIPMVLSTLSWSFLRNGLDMLLSVVFEATDYPLPPGLRHVRLYQGRAYLNVSLLQWLNFDVLGIAPWKIEFGRAPASNRSRCKKTLSRQQGL